jgi:predicted DNA-binding transcriptional regulator YafY
MVAPTVIIGDQRERQRIECFRQQPCRSSSPLERSKMFHPIVCQAIREKRVLQFTYDLTNRHVEPHAYGVDKAGDELLRAWQLSPFPTDWRIFRLDKAIGISLTQSHFAMPRQGYNREDKAMSQMIYCQL